MVASSGYWEEDEGERSKKRKKREEWRGVQEVLQGGLLGVGAASRTWSTSSSGPAT
jgi:hypothetical protein